jgi:hypothetical protein
MLSSKSECFRKLTPLCGTCLRAIAGITGVEQRWIRDAWYVKFGMGPNPEQRGNGDTTEQVCEFVVPDAQTLAATTPQCEHRPTNSSTASTLTILTGLSIDKPCLLSQRVPSLIVEAVQHIGQVAYIRGLLQGPNWRTI